MGDLVPCNGVLSINRNTINVLAWIPPSVVLESGYIPVWNPIELVLESNKLNAAVISNAFYSQYEFYQGNPDDEEIQKLLDNSIFVLNVGDEVNTLTGVNITMVDMNYGGNIHIGLNFQRCVVKHPVDIAEERRANTQN